MLKRGLFFLYFICCCLIANSQNLVINPSFEDTTQFSNGQPDLIGWDNNLGSPDYFSSHFNPPWTLFSTPVNARGIQSPQEGASYVGLGFFDNRNSDTREYLQFELLDTLEKDKLYKISFYLSLADSFELAVIWKDIGIVFQDSLLPNNLDHRVRLLSPVSYSDSFGNASSKIDWQKFELNYIAKGTESVALIGCFKRDSAITIDTVGNGGSGNFFKNTAYYYIDYINISLSVGLVEKSSPPRVKIYPNPANDYVIIEQEEQNTMNSTIQFYDMNGRLVLSKNSFHTGQFTVDVSGLGKGVYFYGLFSEGGMINRGKLIFY